MDDLISRQAAIDLIKSWSGGYEYIETPTDSAVKAFKQLPSAQQWIPCSERLPRQGELVICQCRANIIMALKLDAYGDWYQDANDFYMSGFVIAWMPLPEPYKQEAFR